MADTPQVNIKDYIVKCRQAGMPDSKIIDVLKKANWPQDIIDTAIEESNAFVQPIPEIPQAPITEVSAQNQDTKVSTSQKEESKKIEERKDQSPVKEKKSFSIFAFFAFLLSPIPFLGLALCMYAMDSCSKKKMSGGYFAIFGLIVNLAIMGYIIYVMFQIFSMDQAQLTGFAKSVNDLFNLVPV